MRDRIDRDYAQPLDVEALARGLAPQDVSSYLKQQLRWAGGGFEVLLRGRLFKRGIGLTIDQRLQYLFCGTHYLLSLAIGDYRLTDREVDGVQWWDAVAEPLFTGPGDPSPGQVATEVLQRQPEVLAFLAGQFGPYPFDAAGGVVTAVSVAGAVRPIASGTVRVPAW